MDATLNLASQGLDPHIVSGGDTPRLGSPQSNEARRITGGPRVYLNMDQRLLTVGSLIAVH